MRKMTVFEALQWAFNDELPKGGGVDGIAGAGSAWRACLPSSWAQVERFGELMTLVDTGGWQDRAPSTFIEQGDPHPDAVLLGQAVAALRDMTLALDEPMVLVRDWALADGRAIQPARDAVRLACEKRFWPEAGTDKRHFRGLSPMAMVISSAVLGREPAWDCPEPGLRMVTRGGKPAWFVRRIVLEGLGRPAFMMETDGFNPKTGRPVAGAYRRFEFVDNPVPGLLGRIDRMAWGAAMAEIAVACAMRMQTIRLVYPLPPLMPWRAYEKKSGEAEKTA